MYYSPPIIRSIIRFCHLQHEERKYIMKRDKFDVITDILVIVFTIITIGACIITKLILSEVIW